MANLIARQMFKEQAEKAVREAEANRDRVVQVLEITGNGEGYLVALTSSGRLYQRSRDHRQFDGNQAAPRYTWKGIAGPLDVVEAE
jgi:hypothetical protein